MLLVCSREICQDFRKTWCGSCFNVGQSTDGGCRRYDAACAVVRDVFGVDVDGTQDQQKQKRAGEYGVGMGRMLSRADDVCRMALLARESSR